MSLLHVKRLLGELIPLTFVHSLLFQDTKQSSVYTYIYYETLETKRNRTAKPSVSPRFSPALRASCASGPWTWSTPTPTCQSSSRSTRRENRSCSPHRPNLEPAPYLCLCRKCDSLFFLLMEKLFWRELKQRRRSQVANGFGKFVKLGPDELDLFGFGGARILFHKLGNAKNHNSLNNKVFFINNKKEAYKSLETWAFSISDFPVALSRSCWTTSTARVPTQSFFASSCAGELESAVR